MNLSTPIQTAPPRPRRRHASRAARLAGPVAVLAGAALLASVALPVYESHSAEHRRGAAQDALTEAAVLLEEFFTLHESYTQVFGAAGIRREPTAGSGAYVLAVADPTPECPIDRCYVLTATPRGPQAADACGTLTVRSSGAAEPARCW